MCDILHKSQLTVSHFLMHRPLGGFPSLLALVPMSHSQTGFPSSENIQLNSSKIIERIFGIKWLAQFFLLAI